MKKIIPLVLALLLTCTAFAANKRFDTIIVFGDSLSDTGNLYYYMWSKLPISPPYFEGRFSNGHLWIEHLYNSYYPENSKFSLQNYAVGGAGAVVSYKLTFPYTLFVELGNYFYWNTYGKKETSLYTIWIGANNYVNGPTNVESITDSVVGAIGDGVESLISRGGNKFFIPNLPDLGRAPQSIDWHIESLTTELTLTHNRKLAAKIGELKRTYPNVTIVYFDMYSAFNDTLDHASDYGFLHVNEPCYSGGYIGWLLKYDPSDATLHAFLQEQDSRFDTPRWEMIKNNPVLREAVVTSYLHQLLPAQYREQPSNCDSYVFWDYVHPSAKSHYYIAQKAREALDEAGLEAFIPD